MNPYAIVGSGIETADAASLRARLMAWHDSMVAHERRLRSGNTTSTCAAMSALMSKHARSGLRCRPCWALGQTNSRFYARVPSMPPHRRQFVASAKTVSEDADTADRSRPTRTALGAAGINIICQPVGSVADDDGGALGMTLRESLGGDVEHVYNQIDALLDSEDALLVLFDGDRMVSYTQGFGVSPCQLELLSLDLERSVRTIVGGQSTTRKRHRRNREESFEGNGRGRDAVRRQSGGRVDRGDHRRVVDRRGQSVGSGDSAHGNSRVAAGRVLRLASKTA